MNRLLFALGALAASALLMPGDADAQRFGGGGRGFGGGGFGGFRGGGAMIGGGGAFGSFRGGAIAARPGGFYRGGLAGSGGYRTGFYRPGWGGYGYRSAALYRPGWGYGAYRPYYRGYGGRYPYGGYYRRYPRYGGAVLAGLTLGALSYPYGYGYGYPHYGTAYYGGDCYWVRRRVIGRYGGVVIRNVQVCEY